MIPLIALKTCITRKSEEKRSYLIQRSTKSVGFYGSSGCEGVVVCLRIRECVCARAKNELSKPTHLLRHTELSSVVFTFSILTTHTTDWTITCNDCSCVFSRTYKPYRGKNQHKLISQPGLFIYKPFSICLLCSQTECRPCMSEAIENKSRKRDTRESTLGPRKVKLGKKKSKFYFDLG